MTGISIPNLPPAISLSGSEEIEIVQSGVSRRATLSQVTAGSSDSFGTGLLYTDLANTDIALDVTVIQTAGYSEVGVGSAFYVSDDLATSALAAAIPRACVLTKNNRYFRLMADDGIYVDALGADSVTTRSSSAAEKTAAAATNIAAFNAARDYSLHLAANVASYGYYAGVVKIVIGYGNYWMGGNTWTLSYGMYHINGQGEGTTGTAGPATQMQWDGTCDGVVFLDWKSSGLTESPANSVISYILFDGGGGALTLRNVGVWCQSTSNRVINCSFLDWAQAGVCIGNKFGARMCGTISGTTLTVTRVNQGSLAIGDTVVNGTTTIGTITAFGTGTGGTGTYTLSASATIAAVTYMYSTPSIDTGANLCFVNYCNFVWCGYAGIFIDGADSNGGATEGCSFIYCGYYGLFDSSFLGNSHRAHHTRGIGYGSQAGTTTSKVKNFAPTLVSYNSYYWFVAPGAALAASTTTPGSDASVWVPFMAGGTDLNFAPLWVNGTTYAEGGTYKCDNLNAPSDFYGNYMEADSPGIVVASQGVYIAGIGYPANDTASNTYMTYGSRLGSVDGNFLNFLGGMGYENRRYDPLVDSGRTVSDRITGVFGGNPANGDIILLRSTLYFPASTRVRWSTDRKDIILFDYANSEATMAAKYTGPNTTQTFGRASAVPNALYTPNLFFGDGQRALNSATAMPTTGAYAKGDFVVNTNPSELGTAGSKYIIHGWIRMTTSSNHVLNTDWFQARTLTGN